jgi:hypothetical protein
MFLMQIAPVVKKVENHWSIGSEKIFKYIADISKINYAKGFSTLEMNVRCDTSVFLF